MRDIEFGLPDDVESKLCVHTQYWSVDEKNNGTWVCPMDFEDLLLEKED